MSELKTAACGLRPILDKIRKLRALAESANVHEAAAAAAAAERLIQEHNLSEAALHVDGEPEEGVGAEQIADVGRAIPTWASNLLACLCRAYQCSGFWRHTREGHRFEVYGRSADLGTLRYQYAFFSVEVTRLTERYARGKGRTYANNFRLGAVAAIREAIDGARTAARSHATSSALVVVDRRAELAKERRDADNPDITSSKSTGGRFDPSAFAAGKRAGASINQRSQLAASGARMLGKGT